jgi:hypothetical protein
VSPDTGKKRAGDRENGRRPNGRQGGADRADRQIDDGQWPRSIGSLEPNFVADRAGAVSREDMGRRAHSLLTPPKKRSGQRKTRNAAGRNYTAEWRQNLPGTSLRHAGTVSRLLLTFKTYREFIHQ